ncbi:LOW QUALITY PROTEIN: derlin-1-like [Drosophila serrata]|uniref:LOW QUALITY PROTEIN: derlin-1-like n=1 Tax=Drosophila serrata TaxID=7274 RepID=UPI000A1D2B6B|nr:LOW QUALITY PROTEIN: derlin-1-like [Drosophila serrata]
MITTWYRSLPRLTRYWFTTTVVSCFVSRFNLIPIEWLDLNWEVIYYRWEGWRFVTSIVAFPINPNTAFRFMIYCYFLVTYSGMLEKDQFGRSPAGYLYLLIIIAVLANIGGLLLGVTCLMETTVMSVLYIWCHLNQDVTVSFWFGSRFKAIYLPWVLAAFDFIFNFTLESFVGIFNGHIYYFLMFHYPNLLETPRILKRILPDLYGGFTSFGAPSESRSAAEPNPDHSWGRGITLGGN